MPPKSLNIKFPPEWRNDIVDQKIFFDWLEEMGLKGMGGVYPNGDSFNMGYKNKELPIQVQEFLYSTKLIYGLEYKLF